MKFSFVMAPSDESAFIDFLDSLGDVVLLPKCWPKRKRQPSPLAKGAIKPASSPCFQVLYVARRKHLGALTTFSGSGRSAGLLFLDESHSPVVGWHRSRLSRVGPKPHRKRKYHELTGEPNSLFWEEKDGEQVPRWDLEPEELWDPRPLVGRGWISVWKESYGRAVAKPLFLQMLKWAKREFYSYSEGPGYFHWYVGPGAVRLRLKGTRIPYLSRDLTMNEIVRMVTSQKWRLQ